MVFEITGVQNPKVKAAWSLRDRKDRDRTGLFLIEGFREITRALEAGVVPVQIFFCKSLFLGSNESTLLETSERQGTELFSCTEPVLRKLSYRDRPDGLIAVAKQFDTSLDRFSKTFSVSEPLLLIAESIEKPGNLGTILRSCDAVGVDAAFLADRCTDLFNPNVVRASVGTVFTTPVIEARGEKIIDWCKERGIRIIAATPSAEEEFTEADLTGPVAIAVGTEQLGLSARWMDSADIRVKIPMRGTADSLNVATATTLLLYEVLRQRNQRDGIGHLIRR